MSVALGLLARVARFSDRKPAFRSYLLECRKVIKRGEPLDTGSGPRGAAPPVPQRRRLRDRLSRANLSTLVESFRSGTPAHVLAKRYGVNDGRQGYVAPATRRAACSNY